MEHANIYPQYIFNMHISARNRLYSTGFFSYEKEKLVDESNRLKEIMLNDSLATLEVFCWFTVDRKFTNRQLLIIEQHLEKQIESIINNDTKINVQLIRIHKDAPLSAYIKEVEHILTPLTKKYPDEDFIHYFQQGNAKLNQALLIEGIRNFHSRYVIVYYHNGKITKMNYPTRYETQSWLSLFKTFIYDYDYQGALKLLHDIPKQSEIKDAIQNLLITQLKRLNFAIEEAMESLNKVISMYKDSETLMETKIILSHLLQTDERKRDLERIVELFRQIDIFIKSDDIPSFLVRFYRVREAVLFYLIKHARTSDEPIPISEKNSSIYEVFESLEELYDNWDIDGHYGAYFFLKSTNTYNILNFRNRSFIGHSRNKIEPKELWLSFAGNYSITTAKAKRRFQMDVDLLLRDLGVISDDNFYSMNQLIIQLAEQLRKKEVELIE